jgi:hypothetical protein
VEHVQENTPAVPANHAPHALGARRNYLEYQASLDAIETRAQSITDKLEALAAVTPPAVPTE